MKKYIKLTHNEAGWIMGVLTKGRFFDKDSRDAARLIAGKFPVRYCDDHGDDHKYRWLRDLWDLWYKTKKSPLDE